ncbi:unnamed protein product [Adineta ricciae]|uniref:Uncharacterized protein n=1 Tax=Adineta ricciae TaxID=249248 RepID=A0A815P3Z5_ADIRI|nr:unnamed protein product [Adineta ricciae]CAF1443832.1 unnamed protein product [Adineta ricciae]
MKNYVTILLNYARARQSLAEVYEQIAKVNLTPPQITFTGLSHFNNKVLYMDPVKDAHLDALMRIAEICRETYEKNGIASTDVRPFNAHLTLFKLSKARDLHRRGVKKIDECWKSKYDNHHFGVENFHSLHLCNMLKKQADGYYEIFHEQRLFNHYDLKCDHRLANKLADKVDNVTSTVTNDQLVNIEPLVYNSSAMDESAPLLQSHPSTNDETISNIDSMLLNKFLFPAPKPSTYTLTSHANLFWIPAKLPDELPVPCMFYSPSRSNKKIEYLIIFCHGNGCDIGSMHYTLNEFCENLNVYIISFEYPAYGLCTATSPNQQTINNHADRTFDFVVNTLLWPIERIIMYGHSIGSGAACYLASTQLIGALILQSPYTAISNLVREKVRVLAYLISTRSWNNLEAMKNIKCPALFIHGRSDTVIPADHSQALYDACSNNEGKKLVLLRNEDHNSMTESLLLRYIVPFLEKQCVLMNTNLQLPVIKIDRELREPPPCVLAANEVNSNRTDVFNSLSSLSKASTAATMATIRSISGLRKNQSDEDDD